MRQVKLITTIDELLKYDVPYGVKCNPVVLFERSLWMRFVALVTRKAAQ